MRRSLVDALNDMGNALTSLGWPEGTSIMPNGRKIVYNTGEIFQALADAVKDAGKMESHYHDAVNELCLMCGQFKKEHLGACGACKWKALKTEFGDDAA